MNFRITLLLLFLSLTMVAQPADKLQIGVSTGIASGWWIYTLGTGSGVDRTDNELKLTFEGDLMYHMKRFGIGAGIGYSLLMDNSMEAFEDTRAQRRKYLIAEKQVKLLHYYLQFEYRLFSGSKYQLRPQIRFGCFSIDTIHPEKDNFDKQLFFELGAMNQLFLSERLWLTVRPFYQTMLISVKEEMMAGEQHRIFSLGLGIGLRYTI